MRAAKPLLAVAAALPAMSEAEPVSLCAAGSLTTALGEVVHAYTEAHGTEVATSFGRSGLMHERIEAGETSRTSRRRIMRASRAGSGSLSRSPARWRRRRR